MGGDSDQLDRRFNGGCERENEVAKLGKNSLVKTVDSLNRDCRMCGLYRKAWCQGKHPELYIPLHLRYSTTGVTVLTLASLMKNGTSDLQETRWWQALRRRNGLSRDLRVAIEADCRCPVLLDRDSRRAQCVSGST